MTILQGLPNLFPCPALSWTGSSLMQALCSQLIRLLRPSPRRVFLPGGKWAIRISCVTSGFSQWHRWKAICFYGVWFREGENKNGKKIALGVGPPTPPQKKGIFSRHFFTLFLFFCNWILHIYMKQVLHWVLIRDIIFKSFYDWFEMDNLILHRSRLPID